MKDILKKHKSKRGFTLAEVLITLVIIGVVTALTIPSLLSNINDKTYDAKRQGFATRMAQAISQIGMLNAYEPEGTDDEKEETASIYFIVEALQKVYSITQVCEFENLTACDFPDKTKQIGGDTRPINTYDKWSKYGVGNAVNLGGLNTKGAAFRTKNGESVLLWYNPRCVAEQIIESDTVLEPGMGAGTKNYVKEVCLNMVFDLDGAKKGPNTLNRDIGFAIVLYPDTPYLVVTGGYSNVTASTFPSYVAAETPTMSSSASGYCRNSVSAGGFSKGQWSLASREEIYAFGINCTLTTGNVTAYTWSSTIEGANGNDYGWMVNDCSANTPYAKLVSRNTVGRPKCVPDISK